MKKSILNSAITLAFSSALLSASVLNAQALANNIDAEKTAALDSNTDNTSIAKNKESPKESPDENYMLSGMGVGAVAGTAVAGPVGFVIGGVIGALFGSNQSVDSNDSDNLQDMTIANNAEAKTDASFNTVKMSDKETIKTTSINNDLFLENASSSDNNIQVAQLGDITPITDKAIDTVINPSSNKSRRAQHDELLDIFTADLSLDIYFRSGSTDIENFYPARLEAIANLLNNMQDLEIHLDGYTDRRGNKTQNIALANGRIEKVRLQLINAGVDESRIISKAFGEMKMVSIAGDLDGYTFDRKVLIRFERSTVDSIHHMKTALSETSVNVDTEESISPIAAADNTNTDIITNINDEF